MARETEGKSLDVLIKDSGMTKKHIAKEMGIGYDRLWQLLKNPKEINGERMDQLAKILRVDVQVIWESIQYMK